MKKLLKSIYRSVCRLITSPFKSFFGEEDQYEYFNIHELLELIDEPNRTGCKNLLRYNQKLFSESHGSTHNHQTWKGGYLDHITDGMNIIVRLYATLKKIGRPLPFSLSDALLIFYIHDIEKPWKYQYNAQGEREIIPQLRDKAAQHQFRLDKLKKYNIVLTDFLLNGLMYVEGENKAYKSTERVMNELAAFVHMADICSARIYHNYPFFENDEWIGATRCHK